jgi:hypothetical protein
LLSDTLLQVLSDAKLFNNITADPDVQQLVLQKQLAAFNHALAIVHQHQYVQHVKQFQAITCLFLSCTCIMTYT